MVESKFQTQGTPHIKAVLGGTMSCSKSYRKVEKAAGQVTKGRLVRGEAGEASRGQERKSFLGP